MRVNIAKRNLLGCYLAQDLPHVRTGASVFEHLLKFFVDFETGKFTEEEDKLILREVQKSGDCAETWRRLAKLLNRKDRVVIQNHYICRLKNPHIGTGKWSLTEEAIFIEHFFADKTHSDPRLINSISFPDFGGVSEILNRPSFHINCHWLGSVKPALLAYHGGCLLTCVKADFLDYLIEKKVRGVLDIDWAEATKKFPFETSTSLKCFMKSEVRKFDRCFSSMADKPVHVKLQLSRPGWKDSQFSPKAKSYREKIVELYLQARGVDQ